MSATHHERPLCAILCAKKQSLNSLTWLYRIRFTHTQISTKEISESIQKLVHFVGEFDIFPLVVYTPLSGQFARIGQDIQTFEITKWKEIFFEIIISR